MYSYNFPKLDKWKYTSLETTVFYKALCVTPVPEIVVIITQFSGKNSSSFSLRAQKKNKEKNTIIIIKAVDQCDSEFSSDFSVIFLRKLLRIFQWIKRYFVSLFDNIKQ